MTNKPEIDPSELAKLITQRLEKKYESFIKEGEKALFLGIAEYVHMASDHPISNGLITILLSDRYELQEKLAKAGTAASENFDTKVDDIKRRIGNAANLSEQAKEALRKYGYVVDGSLQSSNGPVRAREDYFDDILRSLKQDFPELVKSYAQVSDEGMIERVNYPETYEEYLLLNRKFEEEKKVSFWGSWNELALVFQAVYRKNEILEEAKKDDAHILELMNYHYLFQDIDQILENKSGRRTHFILEEYKIHINRVHHQLVVELEKLPFSLAEGKAIPMPETISALTTPKTDEEHWYAIETGIGKIKGKEFKLEEGKNPSLILKALSDKKQLRRAEVIGLLELDSDDNAKGSRSANTLAINDVVKRLRKTTGLSAKELVNNNGNITLVLPVIFDETAVSSQKRP